MRASGAGKIDQTVASLANGERLLLFRSLSVLSLSFIHALFVMCCAARSAPKFDCDRGAGGPVLDLHVHIIALARLAGRRTAAVDHLRRENVSYTVRNEGLANDDMVT